MEDNALRLAIVNGFLKANPTDNDFQIVRAEILARMGRLVDALSQLESATGQWKTDVGTVIDKPSANEAVEFFFAKDYGMKSLRVLHWRYARIQLLQQSIILRQNPAAGYKAMLENLDGKYKIGLIAIDFPGQLLEIAFLSRSKDEVERFIAEWVSVLATFGKSVDDAHRANYAWALFRHFTTLQSIHNISDATRQMLRRSPLGVSLCKLSSDSFIIPQKRESLQQDLEDFCRDRR